MKASRFLSEKLPPKSELEDNFLNNKKLGKYLRQSKTYDEIKKNIPY